ncbi:hypothetical protein MKW98_022022, partial [Papaver atlanticum]
MSNIASSSHSGLTKKMKGRSKRTKIIEQNLVELSGSMKTMDTAMERQNKPSQEVDVRRFKKFLGPDGIFHGTEEPIVAEKWLQSIQKEFKAMLVPKKDKVGFATYMFHGDANNWWESVQRMEDMSRMSWKNFVKLFLEQYFPPTAKAAKCMEFAFSQQGDMTVTQLDKKFAELERYTSHLVPTQELKARKLECALKAPIRDRVVSHQHVTYNRILRTALAVKANWVQILKEREESDKKKKVKPNPPATPKRPLLIMLQRKTTGLGQSVIIVDKWVILLENVRLQLSQSHRTTTNYVIRILEVDHKISHVIRMLAGDHRISHVPLHQRSNRGNLMCKENLIMSQRVMEGQRTPSSREYDVIAGMDWMSQNQEILHCSEKKISFLTMNGNRVCVQGERWKIMTPSLPGKKRRDETEEHMACLAYLEEKDVV